MPPRPEGKCAPRDMPDVKPAVPPTFWLHIYMGIFWGTSTDLVPAKEAEDNHPVYKTMKLANWKSQNGFHLASSGYTNRSFLLLHVLLARAYSTAQSDLYDREISQQ